MDNCPNCGSPTVEDLYDGANVFDCGSKTNKFGEIIWHTVDCLFEQVSQLQAQVNDLQSREKARIEKKRENDSKV